MTVGGWIFFGIVAVVVVGFGIAIGASNSDVIGGVVGFVIGAILCIPIFMGFNWYYTNTASGARAVKTQKSEFNNGIERKVTVYDMEGDVIKEYEGKFDVEYDNDRILFDDDKGLRHIIYYPTGTVIIDEVAQ